MATGPPRPFHPAALMPMPTPMPKPTPPLLCVGGSINISEAAGFGNGLCRGWACYSTPPHHTPLPLRISTTAVVPRRPHRLWVARACGVGVRYSVGAALRQLAASHNHGRGRASATPNSPSSTKNEPHDSASCKYSIYVLIPEIDKSVVPSQAWMPTQAPAFD